MPWRRLFPSPRHPVTSSPRSPVTPQAKAKASRTSFAIPLYTLYPLFSFVFRVFRLEFGILEFSVFRLEFGNLEFSAFRLEFGNLEFRVSSYEFRVPSS
jgi:hypothetical protein